MSIDFDRVRADLGAFADDDEEIVIEQAGQCLFVRNGQEISIRLSVSEDGVLLVEHNESTMPYRRFLSHELANLPVLAERILTKRLPIPSYVDSRACLNSPAAEARHDRAVALLTHECVEHPPFASRVVFITADAGQGKTALLRQYQHEQANRFLADESSFLFWHVDLQGRQLLRLSEALMGDLGDLRVSGLWMSAIIRLLRYRALVLAIDGFDELAAEQGASDALGALALLVQQMGAAGTIVAASRRTFFDTDDYIRRANLFGRAGASDCEFDQISLQPWDADDGRSYFEALSVDGKRFESPAQTYGEVAAQLGQADHPMLTRPFLLAQIGRGLLLYDASPADFIKGMDDPLRGVGAVIQAFVKREVGEKWKQKDTGEPYLEEEQHLDLLADVAEEMFRSQRTTIEIDVLETITTLLLDEWNIDLSLRPQIIEMVRMHVLLTPPEDNFALRRFDHEQFQDWFTAYAFRTKLDGLAEANVGSSQTLLSVAHLSDSTAQYVCGLIDRSPERVVKILEGFAQLLEHEWRPSYLQMNVGTLVPFLLDNVASDKWLAVPSGALYSSLVFEGSRLNKVRFLGGTFVNVNLANVVWEDVILEGCELGEIGVDRESAFAGVVLRDCRVDGLRVLGDEETREYSPGRIQLLLGQLGIDVAGADEDGGALQDRESVVPAAGETRKLVQRVLNVFRRTTFMSDLVVTHRFHQNPRRITDEILPLMEEYGVVESRQWKGSGSHKAWSLPVSLEEIERADGDPRNERYAFWRAVDELDRGRSRSSS
jgi:hypothetical protein